MSLRRRDLLAAGVALALPACRRNRLPANLVPDMPSLTPSYWTTLGVQRFGETDPSRWMAAANQTPVAADRLTEASLFGPQGWAHSFKPVHPDLHLLLDLGWDAGPGMWAGASSGTFTVSGSKFPSCTGTPAERLAKLVEKVKLLGWRGLGLRVTVEAHLSGSAMDASDPAQYFRGRIRAAHQVGVGYWKVESAAASTLAVRRLMTQNAAGEAPDLVVEHSAGWGPLNSPAAPADKAMSLDQGRFRTWDRGRKLETALELIGFSRVFRTGETTAHLAIPTTLDRVADLLLRGGADRGNDCLLNCGDELYMACALGCTMGIERHPGWSDPAQRGYDPRLLRYRMTEAVRAVRWQRIAPPWPVGYTKTDLDPVRLADDWDAGQGGHVVMQGAPARIARNGPLPKVSSTGSAPYAVSSVHPNGAAAVATLPRMFSGRGYVYPEADVTMEIEDPMRPIGVFGRYKSLTLDLVAPPPEIRVLAQDLASDQAVEVTDRVSFAGSTMVIPGELINRIGQTAATRNDQSDPGLVLQIYQG